MARPPTDIATFGKIHITEIRPGVWEARARFRKRNGKIARPRRRGKSATAAERALKKAMTTLADDATSKTIDGASKFGRAIDLWLEGFKKRVDRGERAAKSYYDYQDSAEQIRKHMGDLTCREAQHAGLCDETLKTIRDEAAKSKRAKGRSGYSSAKRARTVLSGVCGLAIRHGAMTLNPVPGVEAIEQGDVEPIRALEPEDRAVFVNKLRKWCEDKAKTGRLGMRGQVWTDVPDIAEGMLATGSRPGEILAVIGSGVVPGERTVLFDHHLVRVEGVGIVRQKLRKGRRDALNPKYPSWAAAMFARRKIAAGPGPLFPTWNGQWQDPGNVAKRLRTACDAIGYGWVSARMLRHTVGTHLGESNLSNEVIADQLGNTPEVVQRHYRAPKITNSATADALESLLDSGS